MICLKSVGNINRTQQNHHLIVHRKVIRKCSPHKSQIFRLKSIINESIFAIIMPLDMGLSGIFDVSPFNVESVSNGILSMTTKTTMPQEIYKQCWILFVLFVSNPNAINHYFMWNLRTSFCYQYHNIVIDGVCSLLRACLFVSSLEKRICLADI